MFTHLNAYTLKQWKAQFPTAIWQIDDAALAYKIGFADGLGKLAEFEATIKRMVFPHFFGHPSHTMISDDGGVSFYFLIYLDSSLQATSEGLRPKADARFAMNGGMIFHTGTQPCPNKDVPWEEIELKNGDCPACGKSMNRAIECKEGHHSVTDAKNGEWSIHT